MRRLVLAVGLGLSTGACCIDVARDHACVVARAFAGPYCRPIPREELVCSFDDTEDPAPLSHNQVSCQGALHEGDDCPDIGFSVSCRGEYFVRPGDSC
jgi:hypothetical protein